MEKQMDTMVVECIFEMYLQLLGKLHYVFFDRGTETLKLLLDMLMSWMKPLYYADMNL